MEYFLRVEIFLAAIALLTAFWKDTGAEDTTDSAVGFCSD